jgi:hypothetical protein
MNASPSSSGIRTSTLLLVLYLVLLGAPVGCTRGTPEAAATGGQPDTARVASQEQEFGRAPAHDWTGVYSFEEVWDTEGQDIRNIITYELDVRTQGDSLAAEFRADGYMTSIHLHCTAAADDDHLVVAFKEAGEDNMFNQAGEGDILFTLVRKDDRLLTFWGALEPQATELEDGTPYFKKDTLSATRPSTE